MLYLCLFGTWCILSLATPYKYGQPQNKPMLTPHTPRVGKCLENNFAYESLVILEAEDVTADMMYKVLMSMIRSQVHKPVPLYPIGHMASHHFSSEST